MKKTKIRTIAAALAAAFSTSSTAAFADTIKIPAADNFAALSDRFVKEMLVLNPTTASQAGYHKHSDATTGKVIELDAVLDDLSVAGINKQKDFFRSWQKRFTAETPLSDLGAQDAADWRLIDDQINLQLLDYDHIQNYRHNPTVAVELIGTALFQPLTEEYAPKEIRLGHILSRVEQVPRLLSDIKAYLSNVDPIYISTAVEENDGNIDLIENTIGKEIPKDSPLRERFEKVSPKAVAALKDFSAWLKNDLARRPHDRSWKLGKELYDQKFRLVMEVKVTPEELLRDAETNLKAVRAEMLQLALPMHKEWFPKDSDHKELNDHERENLIVNEVLRKISDDHCKRDQLQQTIEADLEGIKKFIRDKQIVSLGDRDNLKVIPTPVFMRGVLSVAAFHSAPPLNPQAEAEYWVTPIEPSVSDAKAESKLREYNNFALKWLTIHEALPGHYVQFEHLNNIQPVRRRLLRSLFANGPYVEGWAEYIAQVMMDQGYLDNDPRFRLVMRKIRLRLLANTILDVKMQSQDMTDAQAMELMTKESFQTEAEAEGKLKRAKLSSAQLATYYTGLREWQAFRKKYEATAGSSFDMLKFHNAVLDEGPLPVPVVETLLLTK
ncbi:MAG: DUF885 family protein [Cyanobacteria bacterium REEB67]|nr:DUF885 family protein [Cyanobacteria bacterium REEB67]